MLNSLNEYLKLELSIVHREDIFDKTNKLLDHIYESIGKLDIDNPNRYNMESDLRSIFYCLANFNVDVIRFNKDKDISKISNYLFMFIELIDNIWKDYKLDNTEKVMH